MSRFDDLLNAKKIKAGQPDLSQCGAIQKQRPQLCSPYALPAKTRQLKSAAQSGQEMSKLVEKSVAQFLQ